MMDSPRMPARNPGDLSSCSDPTLPAAAPVAFVDTPQARMQFFALLPPHTQLTLVKESAGSWDLTWLEPVLASAWLDWESLMVAEEDQQEALHIQWRERALALCHWMQTIGRVPLEEDQWVGRLDPPLQVLGFSTHETNRLFFRRVLHEVTRYAQATRDAQPQSLEAAMVTLSHFFVAAVVLDLPDEVERLLAWAPDLVHRNILMEWLGKEFCRFIKNAKNAVRGLKKEGDTTVDLINAVNVALRLSRERCLDVLLQNNPKALGTMGLIENQTVWDLDNFHTYYEYGCVPSLLARMHGVHIARMPRKLPNDEHRLLTVRANCGAYKIARKHGPVDEDPSKDPYFLAMVHSGVFDCHPEDSLKMAIESGHMDLVKRLLPLVQDWEGMRELFAPKNSPLALAIRFAQYNPKAKPGLHKHVEAMLLTFLNGCLARGQRFVLDNECVSRDLENISTVEPFLSMAKWNCHGLMLKFLAEGTVDLQMLCQPGTPEPVTLMQALDLQAPASAAVVRSFLARKQAHGLLDDMDAQFLVASDRIPQQGTFERLIEEARQNA